MPPPARSSPRKVRAPSTTESDFPSDSDDDRAPRTATATSTHPPSEREWRRAKEVPEKTKSPHSRSGSPFCSDTSPTRKYRPRSRSPSYSKAQPRLGRSYRRDNLLSDSASESDEEPLPFSPRSSRKHRGVDRESGDATPSLAAAAAAAAAAALRTHQRGGGGPSISGRSYRSSQFSRGGRSRAVRPRSRRNAFAGTKNVLGANPALTSFVVKLLAQQAFKQYKKKQKPGQPLDRTALLAIEALALIDHELFQDKVGIKDLRRNLEDSHSQSVRGSLSRVTKFIADRSQSNMDREERGRSRGLRRGNRSPVSSGTISISRSRSLSRTRDRERHDKYRNGKGESHHTVPTPRKHASRPHDRRHDWHSDEESDSELEERERRQRHEQHRQRHRRDESPHSSRRPSPQPRKRRDYPRPGGHKVAAASGGIPLITSLLRRFSGKDTGNRRARRARDDAGLPPSRTYNGGMHTSYPDPHMGGDVSQDILHELGELSLRLQNTSHRLKATLRSKPTDHDCPLFDRLRDELEEDVEAVDEAVKYMNGMLYDGGGSARPSPKANRRPARRPDTSIHRPAHQPTRHAKYDDSYRPPAPAAAYRSEREKADDRRREDKTHRPDGAKPRPPPPPSAAPRHRYPEADLSESTVSSISTGEDKDELHMTQPRRKRRPDDHASRSRHFQPPNPVGPVPIAGGAPPPAPPLLPQQQQQQQQQPQMPSVPPKVPYAGTQPPSGPARDSGFVDGEAASYYYGSSSFLSDEDGRTQSRDTVSNQPRKRGDGEANNKPPAPRGEKTGKERRKEERRRAEN